MANPSNSSLQRLTDLIDTFTLDDKSVESAPDHNQTTSNLHVSITNDTKPKLPANTTSDSVTNSKSTDDTDSNNEEQDIKINYQYDTPSPDQQRERSITPIANRHKDTMSDLDEPEPEDHPEPEYESKCDPEYECRPRRDAEVNFPQISDDDDNHTQNDIETIHDAYKKNMHGFSNASNKSSRGNSKNTTPRLAPIGGGQAIKSPYSSMDLANANANSRRASSSVSYGEYMGKVDLEIHHAKIVCGYLRTEWYILQIHFSIKDISKYIWVCYHDPEARIPKNSAQIVHRPSASASSGSGSGGVYVVTEDIDTMHRYSNGSNYSFNNTPGGGSGNITPYSPSRASGRRASIPKLEKANDHGDGDEVKENNKGKVCLYTDTRTRASIFLSQEAHDQLKGNIPSNYVDPASTINEAADEEYKEESNEFSSLAGLGPMLRQLSDERKQETRHRASIIITKAKTHDSNHDELQNDIPMEHEDPPSTINEAADEEVKEESNDSIDDEDSANHMELDLAEMVASGGDARGDAHDTEPEDEQKEDNETGNDQDSDDKDTDNMLHVD